MICKMTRSIYVTFQKEGIHAYADAPEAVSFLRTPHRHMFHFKVWMRVEHNEREVEFIMLKRELEELYRGGALQLNNMSCESMADELITYLSNEYPNRNLMVEVSEDGENGAVLTYEPVL